MKRFFFLVCLFSIFSVRGMETGVVPVSHEVIPVIESPKKITLYDKEFECVDVVVDSLKRLSAGDEWIGAWYTVTDKDFVQAASDAVSRKAQVTLYVDYYTMSPQCSGGESALQELAKAGVAVYVFNPVGKIASQKQRVMLHTKMALITKKIDGKKSVIQGSANLTKAARTVNSEMITYFPNDLEAHTVLKSFIDLQIAPHSKKLSECSFLADDHETDLTAVISGSKVITTPKKGSHALMPSLQYNIQNILSQRIENTSKNGEIIVLTMTLSSYSILRSLIKAAKSGSRIFMLFDGKSAEKLSPSLIGYLEQLAATGNAQILVSAKKEGLQHAKSIAIMRSPKDYIIATGTGNLVHTDSAMVNVWDVMSSESADDFIKVKKIFERERKNPDVMLLDDFRKSISKRSGDSAIDLSSGKKIKA